MPIIGAIEHKTLGRVVVNMRPHTRSVSARWRKGLVNLNVPFGTKADDIHRILDDFTPRLVAAKPRIFFRPGQQIELPDFAIAITSQKFQPNKILASAKLPLSLVEVGTGIDTDCDETSLRINQMILKIARHLAPSLLIPRAREIAARLGRQPAVWKVSGGHRVLGVCNAKGIISLSYVLVFLPHELRDYVICHEIAHLSEMNHSERFHRLLDSYLGGREASLAKSLRTFSWPIIRN